MSKNPKAKAFRPKDQDQDHQKQVPDQGSDQTPLCSGEPSAGADAPAPAEPAPPASAEARNEGQAEAPAKPSPAGAKFDLSQAELHARGQKSAPVQPPKPQKGNSNVLYIEGAASTVPFSALDSVWRALWSIFAAVLGVDRTQVHYAPAIQLEGGQLLASAHYWMSSDLVERLAVPESWAKLDLGLRMFCDSALWQDDKLEARYAGQPWQELLETIRTARDEIAGAKLPCAVDVEFTRIGRVITIGPGLAPNRAPAEDVRIEFPAGRSVGFKFNEVHLMHFATKKGHASVDVVFKPDDELIKQVRQVSQELAPLIEVELEVRRQDGVIVSRTLKSIKVIVDSLFPED
jgi:hypothetical protein